MLYFVVSLNFFFDNGVVLFVCWVCFLLNVVDLYKDLGRKVLINKMCLGICRRVDGIEIFVLVLYCVN